MTPAEIDGVIENTHTLKRLQETPDSPAALGDLGASLGKSGISVTTIGLGLGYNEDLMVRLAEKSDGNHAFVENSRDLSRIFEYEFGDILSVVAQDVKIKINCLPGVKPVVNFFYFQIVRSQF